MSDHHLKLTMRPEYLDVEFSCTAPELVDITENSGLYDKGPALQEVLDDLQDAKGKLTHAAEDEKPGWRRWFHW